MNNKCEVLDKLALRTIEYLRKELGMKIDDDYKIEEVDKVDYFDIAALISLSNDMVGTVGMSVTNKLATSLVEPFIYGDVTKEEIADLSSENIAETLNITFGNILKDLTVVKNGGSVTISTPYVLHNSVVITKKNNGTMYLCKLKQNNEIIILSYFI